VVERRAGVKGGRRPSGGAGREAPLTTGWSVIRFGCGWGAHRYHPEKDCGVWVSPTLGAQCVAQPRCAGRLVCSRGCLYKNLCRAAPERRRAPPKIYCLPRQRQTAVQLSGCRHRAEGNRAGWRFDVAEGPRGRPTRDTAASRRIRRLWRACRSDRRWVLESVARRAPGGPPRRQSPALTPGQRRRAAAPP
jgi:hypothetical protein